MSMHGTMYPDSGSRWTFIEDGPSNFTQVMHMPVGTVFRTKGDPFERDFVKVGSMYVAYQEKFGGEVRALDILETFGGKANYVIEVVK